MNAWPERRAGLGNPLRQGITLQSGRLKNRIIRFGSFEGGRQIKRLGMEGKAQERAGKTGKPSRS